ncbi:sialate O-acetylesterase [Wenyingzhuangia sp. IMCC45533]
MKKSSIAFVIFLVTLVSCKTASIKENKKQAVVPNEVHVVLLAGQSNMAGAGNYDELDDSVKARIEKVANRVYVSQSNTAQKPLSYFMNKPSKKYNFTKRFGPELFVGLTLAEANPNQEFLLIKEAKGGTALYGAWNPDWTLEKAKLVEKGERKQGWNLCKMHMDNIEKNLNILKQKGKTYKFIGMAWMQGENDGGYDIAANSYAENLEKLINKYRTAYGKDLPFVYGQINSRYGVKDGAKRVREAMELVATKVPNTYMIKTTTDTSWSDYPKYSDNVHYNAEGQKRLGTKFAQELMNLK